MDDTRRALDTARSHAATYLDGLDQRPVLPADFDVDALAEQLGDLPESGSDPAEVVDRLGTLLEPGLTAMNGPRFFGFVIGATLPAALGADWLLSTWDQNTGLLRPTPATTTAENVAGRWLLDLVGLAPDCSFAFLTGGQMANWTGLNAGRHEVLRRVGWDAQRQGLQGAPRVRVVAGEERHSTIDRSVRFLGLGLDSIVEVDADDQGRMRPDALRATLDELDGPLIVCAQTGNIDTGAFDDVGAVCDLAHVHDAWVHVDGAIGLLAGASDTRRSLLAGFERADSWSTDCHKLLNTTFDCGFVATAHPAAHAAACGVTAAYLEHTDAYREPMQYNPEFSRRARALPALAALMQLGRRGVGELVDRLCDGATQFGERFDAVEGVDVCNDVVFNQVLVRFRERDGTDDDHDRRTRAVIEGLQREGTCFMSGTTRDGREYLRVSVVSWRTTPADIDRSADAILKVNAALA